MTKLVAGEAVVLGADGPICVTTHRVRSEVKRLGSHSVKEIPLEEVSYQAISMSTRPILLAIAGFFVIFAAYTASSSDNSTNTIIFAVVGAMVFAIVYLLDRKSVVVIASSGGRIELAARAIPAQTLDWLLLKVTEAKDQRLHVLGAGPPMVAPAPLSTQALPHAYAASR